MYTESDSYILWDSFLGVWNKNSESTEQSWLYNLMPLAVILDKGEKRSNLPYRKKRREGHGSTETTRDKRALDRVERGTNGIISCLITL
jgi:hypothetical protein